MRIIDWSFLADPSYKPPERLLDLNLKVDFKGLLKQFDKKTLVRFAVNEAKLVLPIFESKHPDDDRPRRALEAAEGWLLGSNDAHAANVAVHAANDARVAYASAAYAAVRAAEVAYASAAYAAYASAAWAAAHAAHSAVRAASAASAAYAAARAAAHAAAYQARRADSSISVEDQAKRLLRLS